MLKRFLACFLLFLAVGACDPTVENSARSLGGDVFCRFGGPHVAICYSTAKQKGYICFADSSEHGMAVCIEGLPPDDLLKAESGR